MRRNASVSERNNDLIRQDITYPKMKKIRPDSFRGSGSFLKRAVKDGKTYKISFIDSLIITKEYAILSADSETDLLISRGVIMYCEMRL